LVNVVAVRSAALRGEFAEVILHHDSDLSGTPYYRELVQTPGLKLRRLHVPSLLARCGRYEAGMLEVYGRLRAPAARSDLVRLALLYAEGGVYLDIDTVTLHSFRPLCRGVRAFCGRERIIYSAAVRSSSNPLVHLAALARSQLRGLLRRIPHGWAAFRRIERLFPLAVNNAVLGAAAQAPFIAHCIEQMLEIAPERQARPYVIGPHLLQSAVASYTGGDLAVHGSQTFFPLGPEISQHWFRLTRRVDLASVLSAETRLVHWYASVRSRDVVKHIDPAYVRAHVRDQLFSALVEPFVRDDIPLE
jgi:hypothetical protein